MVGDNTTYLIQLNVRGCLTKGRSAIENETRGEDISIAIYTLYSQIPAFSVGSACFYNHESSFAVRVHIIGGLTGIFEEERNLPSRRFD